MTTNDNIFKLLISLGIFALVLVIYFSDEAYEGEYQSRISQCKSNPSLDYPEVKMTSLVGYGGINLLAPCSVYRNLTGAWTLTGTIKGVFNLT